MEQLVLVIHVLTVIAIIGLILLQQGKGGGIGASFGAGSSQTLFGSQGGSSALTKSTAILVAVFFATSFGLAIIAKDKANTLYMMDIPTPTVVEDRQGVDEFSTEIPTVEGVSSDSIPTAEPQHQESPDVNDNSVIPRPEQQQ